MTIIARIVAWLWGLFSTPAPAPRHYLRVACKACGKVLAQTSRGTWRHRCAPKLPLKGAAPCGS